jgi:hypothetical protein
MNGLVNLRVVTKGGESTIQGEDGAIFYRASSEDDALQMLGRLKVIEEMAQVVNAVGDGVTSRSIVELCHAINTSIERTAKAERPKKVKFLVVDECALCYAIPEYPHPNFVSVLHASILRGALAIRDGDLLNINSRKSVRPATLKDFADYMICPKGYLKQTDRYEPIPAV